MRPKTKVPRCKEKGHHRVDFLTSGPDEEMSLPKPTQYKQSTALFPAFVDRRLTTPRPFQVRNSFAADSLPFA